MSQNIEKECYLNFVRGIPIIEGLIRVGEALEMDMSEEKQTLEISIKTRDTLKEFIDWVDKCLVKKESE